MNREIVYSPPKRLFSWGTRSGLVTRITRFYSLDETNSDMSLSSCVTERITQFQSRDKTSSSMSLRLFSRKCLTQSVSVRQTMISVSPLLRNWFLFIRDTKVLRQLLSRRVNSTDNRPIFLLLKCCVRLFLGSHWQPQSISIVITDIDYVDHDFFGVHTSVCLKQQKGPLWNG